MIRVACMLLTTWPRRADMVPDSLRSYLAQEYRHRALWVVNDGTPLRAARADVTVLNVPPGLPMGAKRNLVLRAVARQDPDGWALAPWDDDDVMLPHHLTALLGALRGGGAYAGSHALIGADAVMRVAGVWHRRDHSLLRPRTHSASLVTARFALARGGWPPIDMGEDYAMYAAAVRAGVARFHDTATYVYRRHGGNFSRSTSGAGSVQEYWATKVAQGADDQARWPDPRLAALQIQVDALRARPLPPLIVPG